MLIRANIHLVPPPTVATVRERKRKRCVQVSLKTKSPPTRTAIKDFNVFHFFLPKYICFYIFTNIPKFNTFFERDSPRIVQACKRATLSTNHFTSLIQKVTRRIHSKGNEHKVSCAIGCKIIKIVSAMFTQRIVLFFQNIQNVLNSQFYEIFFHLVSGIVLLNA